MASTYLALNVHIVFATRGRAPMIDVAWRKELHAYIGGTIRGLGAKPEMVGGVEDHVHVLVGLRGTHAVGEIVREIKKASNAWAKERFDGFGWQEGYGAFSVSPAAVERTVAYIANQEDHHKRLSSSDELRNLLAECGIEYDVRYFE
ncbi:MAG TPA: transposase [Fimbriimonas sp.]|nr:transposase [Fimbriimonas sp.]